MKGRIVSEETKVKLSIANKGKAKNNLSKTMKGTSMYKDKEGNILRLKKDDKRVLSSEYMSVQKGRIYSDKTKEKMSKSRTGLLRSKESKSKISESNGYNIKIFNNYNNEVYYCTNGFAKFCKLNNLPLSLFKKSYQNGTIIIPKLAKYQIYKDWYAIKI